MYKYMYIFEGLKICLLTNSKEIHPRKLNEIIKIKDEKLEMLNNELREYRAPPHF